MTPIVQPEPANTVKWMEMCGDVLFNELEKTKLGNFPETIRNIFKLLDVDRISIIAKIDDAFKQKMESFMQTDFAEDIIDEGHNVKQYLGTFSSRRDKFKFTIGQVTFIDMLVDLSKEILRNNFVNTNSAGTPSVSGVSNGEIEQPMPTTSMADHLKNLARTLENWIKGQAALAHVRNAVQSLKLN